MSQPDDPPPGALPVTCSLELASTEELIEEITSRFDGALIVLHAHSPQKGQAAQKGRTYPDEKSGIILGSRAVMNIASKVLE